MKNENAINLAVCLALSMAMLAAAQADEKRSPVSAADMARTIAPFVDDDTIAIAHVDLARIDAEKLFAAVAPFVPAGHPLLRMHQPVRQRAQTFLEAGGRDLFVVLSMANLPEPGPFVLVPLDKHADEAALRALADGAFMERIGDLLFIGSQEARQRLAEARPIARPELGRALEAVAGSQTQVAFIPSATVRRVAEELMPSLPTEAGGGPTTTLTRGMLWAALGVDHSPEPSLRFVAQSQSGDAARALQGHTARLVHDRLPQSEKFAAVLQPEIRQDRLVLALDNDRLRELGGALRPLADSSAAALRRRESTHQLKQIGLAIHSYSDVKERFPPAAVTDAQGRPLLSWRVAILPYLDQEALYKQFHLDEPWDSEHNRTLIERMPEVYRSFSSSAPQDRSSFVVAIGPGTVFEAGKVTAFRDITDGTSNTLMVFEAADDQAVAWTKPGDLKFDREHPSAGFTTPYSDGRLLLFCDGSVHFVTQSLDDETIRRLILRNDGIPLPQLR
ncbi:MAG TPA: DUF1559 domain-containing protein [Pirellulales bacterium]|nr:DUF1559 domain-containing protein [Pirellulales bacterium]